jgi:hypothetical protein
MLPFSERHNHLLPDWVSHVEVSLKDFIFLHCQKFSLRVALHLLLMVRIVSHCKEGKLTELNVFAILDLQHLSLLDRVSEQDLGIVSVMIGFYGLIHDIPLVWFQAIVMHQVFQEVKLLFVL